MKALVTGATGFIGGNVVAALLARGYQVRALVRHDSPRRNLAGRDVELVVGDLSDPGSLERALRGCQVLFHVAAHYALWTPDPARVYETNVRGTANVLAAAERVGIERVVYTSSESTVGIAREGALGTEELFVDPALAVGHYKRSKCLAERLALGMAAQGLPLVVVNPTTPVGPGDVRPTPTGQIIVDYLKRRMPAYVDTGLNVVDVGDVALGHVLALEQGRQGERYILGHRNLTLRELFQMLERVTGLPAPRVRMPHGVALAAAYASELASRLSRRPPRVPLAGVQVARHYRYFDCSKALRELDLPQTSIEDALARAVAWFREEGMVN